MLQSFFVVIKVCLCIVSCIFKRYKCSQIISVYQHSIHLRTRLPLNIHILDLCYEVPNGYKIVNLGICALFSLAFALSSLIWAYFNLSGQFFLSYGLMALFPRLYSLIPVLCFEFPVSGALFSLYPVSF